MGYAASAKDTAAQAPYRWNSNDPQAAAVNSAEVIGKQLVGKKAEFGGDGVKNETRKFGAVYVEDGIDYGGFTDYFAKFGGKITNSGSFAASALGDPTEVQTEAATMMAKMKDTGVTTVVMFVGYPQFGPLMESATKLDYYPGVVLHRLGIQRSRPRRSLVPDRTVGARLRPVVHLSMDRARHAGTPCGAVRDSGRSAQLVLGHRRRQHERPAHDTDRVVALAGIHAAGPNLPRRPSPRACSPIPPRGGRSTISRTAAWSRTARAQAPLQRIRVERLRLRPVLVDTETTGPSNGLGTVGKGVGFFVDDAKRYVATTWPNQQFAWFDKSQSDRRVHHPRPHRGSVTPATATAARRRVVPASPAGAEQHRR